MERKLFFWPIILLFMFFPGGPATAWAAPAQAPGRQKIDQTVHETLALQKETTDWRQAWLDERRELEEASHALELEALLLEARSKKLKGYSQQRQSEIARLESGLNEMDEIGIRLEPFLDEMVNRIAALQTADLPFSLVERERRLADLREGLNSYGADLAEKLRRVMEVLKIEAGFGRGFEVSDESLILDGVETTVRRLRLGRIGLYYLTLDGERAGWFNQTAKQWQPLSGAAVEAVKEALRMTLKQRAFDLVRLPVAGGKP
ncbi:MAG: DUF3450 domain-containing protein [Deltaproteobacteria bacterium]|nr:DUF3450 domain-containing protein [Deltaproteobacteria bacterium]